MHSWNRLLSGLALGTAVLAAPACSSSSKDSGGGGNNDTSTCSIALTGAVTTTDDCSGVPLADYTTATGKGSLSIEHSTTDTSLASSTVEIIFNGAPSTATTYTESTPGINASASVHQNSNVWRQNVGNGGATTGTFTLKFTSLDVVTSGASGTDYTPHGTLTIVLPAVAGNTATGNVTLTATF